MPHSPAKIRLLQKLARLRARRQKESVREARALLLTKAVEVHGRHTSNMEDNESKSLASLSSDVEHDPSCHPSPDGSVIEIDLSSNPNSSSPLCSVCGHE